MTSKKHLVIGPIFCLLLTIVVVGIYWSRQKTPLKDFSKVVEADGISDLILTIYYNNPTIVTGDAWSVDEVIRRSENSKIVIPGNILQEYADLLRRLGETKIKPVRVKAPYKDVRIYYVFTNKDQEKILDVAMWGGYIERGIYVNCTEVKESGVFYEVILPFLPEDAANALKSYLQNH